MTIIFHEEGVCQKNYDDLTKDVRHLSCGLRKKGVRQGDTVVLFAPNGYEWIVACLAVIKAGAIAVPVDIQTQEKDLRYILNDSGARHIFTVTEQKELVQAAASADSTLYFLEVDDWRNIFSDKEEPHLKVVPDDTAVLFYTSGTTGHPKGVPLSHANIVFQLQALKNAGLMKENDRVLLPLPMHHVYPLVVGTFVPLSLGLCIVMPQSVTGPAIMRALKEGRVTTVIGVPRLYRALYEGIIARIQEKKGLLKIALNGLLNLSLFIRVRTGIRLGKVLLFPLHKQMGVNISIMACGGSALPADLHARLEALGWPVGIGYGLTETAPILTLNHPKHSRIGSAGKPVAGVELRLEQNEIFARGPNVFHGYHNLPRETEKVLSKDQWFRTGDLGYFDKDGYLFITGRVSTLIVTESGKNIQPEDVEEIYQEHPLIDDIGILLKDNKLVGVIVPDFDLIRKQNRNINTLVKEAVAQQSRKLPSYRRISDFAIAQKPLARTRLGKIRRHLLEERFAQVKGEKGLKGQPDQKPIAIEEMSAQDRALLENTDVRKLWEWLTKRYHDKRLTPDTSMQLDLDIDSLEWVNLTLEIRHKIGIELNEEAIIRIETVRDLLKETGEQLKTGKAAPAVILFENPEGTMNEEQKKWLRPLSMFGKVMSGVFFSLNWILMKLLFRVKVKNIENLPGEGPYVIMPNHVSFLDPMVLGAVLGPKVMRQTYWAGWTGILFVNAVTRFISRIAQVIPIDADRAALSSLAFGAAVLKRDKNLVWFPEGARSHSGDLNEFKAGLGILLNHFKVPVVPVMISGTYEAWPVHKKLPRPHAVTVVVGRPIEVDELEHHATGENPPEKIMQLLYDRVLKMKET